MGWIHYINDKEVTVSGARSLKIQESVEYFRKRVFPSGALLLSGSDYTYMKGIESNNRNDKHTYKAEYNGTVKSWGEFLIEDCIFDDVRKTCEISVSPRDEYTYIEENKDIEVNILTSDSERITGYIYSWYQFRQTRWGSSYEPPIDTSVNLVLRHDIYESDIDYWNVSVHYSERIIVHRETTMDGWTKFAEYGDLWEYARQPAIGGYGIDTEDIVSMGTFYNLYSGSYGDRYVFCQEKTGVNGIEYYRDNNDWYIVDEGVMNLYDLDAFNASADPASPDHVLREWEYIVAIRKTAYNGKVEADLSQRYKGYELKSCIETILNEAMPAFTGAVKSTFLFNDDACIGEPDLKKGGQGIGRDYAGNQTILNKYLISKDDFIRPRASELATVNKITFKTIADYLEKLNVKWHIDLDGNLRFEHVYYYNPTEVGIDLTDKQVTGKYSYYKDETPNRIIFDEQEAGNDDFIKKQLIYGEVPAIEGTAEKKDNKSYSGISVDIDYLNTHLDQVSNDGFVLVEAEDYATTLFGLSVTLKRIAQIQGISSGDTIQNAGLSLANVVWYYWRYDCYRPSFELSGYTNLTETTRNAATLKKMKKHEIIFTYEDINVLKLAETNLGTGEFVIVEYSPCEGSQIKAELKYE